MIEEQIEDVLRNLPLRRPPDQLDQRVQSALGWRRIQGHSWVLALLFATGGFVLGYALKGPSSTVRPPSIVKAPGADGPLSDLVDGSLSFDPQRIDWSTNQLLPSGWFVVDDGPPIQALRRQSVNRTLWIDPTRQITVEMQRPREQMVLIRQTPY